MKNNTKFLSAAQNAHNSLTIKELTSMGGGGQNYASSLVKNLCAVALLWLASVAIVSSCSKDNDDSNVFNVPDGASQAELKEYLAAANNSLRGINKLTLTTTGSATYNGVTFTVKYVIQIDSAAERCSNVEEITLNGKTAKDYVEYVDGTTEYKYQLYSDDKINDGMEFLNYFPENGDSIYCKRTSYYQTFRLTDYGAQDYDKP